MSKVSLANISKVLAKAFSLLFSTYVQFPIKNSRQINKVSGLQLETQLLQNKNKSFTESTKDNFLFFRSKMKFQMFAWKHFAECFATFNENNCFIVFSSLTSRSVIFSMCKQFLYSIIRGQEHVFRSNTQNQSISGPLYK